MTGRLDALKPRARIGAIAFVAAALAGWFAMHGSAGASSLCTPSGAAAAQADVLPYPGTPDAQPQTQINFSALTPSQIKSVTVTGSLSGRHAGKLIALVQHDGSAFEPSRPFVGGDHVTVHAALSCGGAAGARGISFSFTVVAPADVHFQAKAIRAATAEVHSAERLATVHQTINPAVFTHTFHSEPSLHPPVVVVANRDPDTASGDIMTDAQRSIQAGPLILNAQGQPVWFAPVSGGNYNGATDLAVQNYQGQPELTFWEGNIADGWGQGKDVIMNHSYQTIATVKAANGLQADLHEFYVTPQGDALITAYQPIHADLSSVGGSKNGVLLDSIIQEINIRTGQLLWQWQAYGHIHLGETYAGKPNANPYDFFHVNSIEPMPNGTFLVSARDTFAVYDIDPKTGKIDWILGGKHSSFKIAAGASFQWQHDAERQPNGDITLFDDADGYYKSASESRGMRVRLNTKTMTASVVHSYVHSPPVLSPSEGSVQRLTNGNVFVGFGSTPYFAQYSQPGAQIFSGRFIYPVEFYRAYRFSWYGTPTGQPSVAASPTTSGTTIYASWNGATEIASWKVYAGPTKTSLAAVASRAFTGFETGIPTSSTQAYFFVQALNSDGEVLGNSPIIAR